MAKFRWSEACEKSFQELKKWLTTSQVLTLTEGYAARQLKVHEKNYPTRDLELAAVVFALKNNVTTFMVFMWICEPITRASSDWVYLNVSPMKGVMRFCKKGNLSPWYIGPYKISKRIGNVAYELELQQELASVDLVFHVFMLKMCMCNPSLIIPTEDIGIMDSLSYGEIHVQILDRKVHKLRTNEVASVKVLWRNLFVEEPTWEAEEDMKKRYPHLFESREIPDQGRAPRAVVPTTSCGPSRGHEPVAWQPIP
ncbi:hypothetical protein MTR67_039994 [Solanum verrucosum]|uniref:Uncharacterized protein n=1 Tax=Solanum verrucosum TaxID=315347 RepID=A0AAF0ZRQ2_SOLVR|nr:hypothetical protein MTR67_039994 [Solanum verrucosum]